MARFAKASARERGQAALECVVGVPAAVEDVFAPKFYQMSECGYHLATSTDWGLVECILQLEGVETFYGVPLERLEGATLAAKETALRSMPVEAFQELVNSDGFSFRTVPMALYIVPGRFAVIRICGEASHGLAWLSFGGTSTTEHALGHLKCMIEQKVVPEGAVQSQQLTVLVDAVKNQLAQNKIDV